MRNGEAADRPWWLAAPFVALAARWLRRPGPSWRPARTGMVEPGGFVLVAAAALPAL